MISLTRRFLTHVFRRVRQATLWLIGRRARRRFATLEEARKVRLLVSPMESRDHTGNLCGGIALAALGYQFTDPLQGMAMAVGDLAMMAALPSSSDSQPTVGNPPQPLTKWLPDAPNMLPPAPPAEETGAGANTEPQIGSALVGQSGDPLEDYWTIPTADVGSSIAFSGQISYDPTGISNPGVTSDASWMSGGAEMLFGGDSGAVPPSTTVPDSGFPALPAAPNGGSAADTRTTPGSNGSPALVETPANPSLTTTELSQQVSTAPAPLANVPVLQSAYRYGEGDQARLCVEGTVQTNAPPGMVCTIDFFSAGRHLGATQYTATSADSTPLHAVLSADVAAGQSVFAVLGGAASAPVIVSAGPDSDRDGVPNWVEALASRGAGGADQAGVTSLPTAVGDQYVTLDAGDHRLADVRATALPAGVSSSMYPYGLFGFTVEDVAPGGSAEVTLTLPDGAGPTGYRKWDESARRFSDFAFDGTTGATFDGNVVTLHFVDGGRGDADGLANGVIVDPGAPAQQNDSISKDLDGKTPVFGSATYQFDVPAGSEYETAVGTVAATDPLGNPLTYGSDSAWPLTIDPTTGALSVYATGALTEGAAYTFSVWADNGLARGTATVTLNVVSPTNDSPTFDATSYDFTVPVDGVYGTFIDSVHATDPEGDTLSYWADWSWPFGIEAETGSVSLYATDDLQVGQVYHFTAWVSDESGSATVPVTIQVVEGGGSPSGGGGGGVTTMSAGGGAGGARVPSGQGGGDHSPMGGGGGGGGGGGTVTTMSGGSGGSLVCSADPTVSGNSTVFEGSVYTLALNANGATVLNWNIDWDDGQVQQYSGSTTQATHVYADGDESHVIKVTVLVQDCSAGSFEGLTPGYWKQPQHFNQWYTYRPSDNYEATFGVSNSQKPPKLIDALAAGGGGIKALWRHSTAALLNASHPYINYRYTIPEIKSMVQYAYATGNYEQIKNLFEVENELGADLSPGNGGQQVAIYLEKPLLVRNVPPTLVLSGASTTTIGQTYTLNLSSTDPGQDTITSWRINWGDGQEQTVSGNPTSVTHVYNAVGPVTISATATDEDGTWASNTLPVTVGANSLSGFVYHDANNNGVKDPSEAGLFGAVVALTGTDNQGVAVNRTAVTDFAGAYLFDTLKAGTYTVTETQPTGWTDGIDTVGTPALGATVQANDRLGVFTFPTGVNTASANNNFGERQVSISGRVFADANWSGIQDTAPPNPEVGISGVTVTLKNAAGVTIDTRTTAADGSYDFGPRAPALYTVVETQPNGYGSSTPDVVSINLAVVGQNIVNFGDTPCGLASWDTGEDGGSTGGKGTATESGGHLLLREGDSFLVWARKQFVVPDRPGVLRLTYEDLSFDTDSTGTIRDAFEAAIIDPTTGATLVLPYAAKRQAGFNVTEGLPVVTGQGTVETDGVVSFDLSGLSPGTAAELVVRLVNNDDAHHNDEDTHVLVHCVDVEADEAAKFFVVDDAVDSTFRYDPAGGPMGNSALLGPNGAPASPRGAAASADGSRMWVVDATRTVWVYDGSGTPVGAWQASDTALTNPQGITTNGTDIWLVDAGAGRVYRYANAAALTVGTAAATSSFALNANNTRPSDLVTDGTTIWVTDEGTDEVFVYSLTGTLQGHWTLDTRNTNASGITLNPAGGTDLWVVDRQDLMVYHYATGRAQTSGSLSATDTFALSAGEGRPEGIADPPISSTATDLWLAFPYAWNTITNPEDEQYQTHKYRLYLTADTPTTGTISIPGYFTEAFSVTPGNVTTINVPASAALGYSADATFADKGIHVTSGAPISIVGMDRWRFTTDSYLVLPTAGLGTEYLLASFAPIDHIAWGSQFAVMAVEDDTQVTITPTVPHDGNPPGTAFTITLQQGDVYQLADLTRDYDVTGSLIQATKPVAVYGTNRGTNIPEYSLGAADYIIEQVQPISAWGTHYLEMPHRTAETFFSDPNRTSTYRILGSVDNTQVQVTFYPPSGSPTTDTYTLNRGQFVQLHAYNNLPERDPRYPVEIVASQPVLVAHFADSTFAPTDVEFGGEIVADVINGPGDPFMSILSPVSQWTDSYAVPIAPYSEDLQSEGQAYNFLNVLVATADVSSLRLNGRPITETGHSSGSNTLTTLNDTTKNWAADQWQNWVVKITAGTGAGQVRTVASNTATQLTVSRDWDTVPDNTSEYVIGEFTALGNSGYSGLQVPVPPGTLQFLSSTSGQRFTVVSYGFSDFDSYGHLAGTRLQSTGPAITIDSPAEGSEFPSNQTVLVTGRATTSTPSAPIVSVTVDGQEVEALDPAGHFFTRVTVQPGRNFFEFQATDSLGRIATTFLTLTGREAISPNEGLLDIAGFRAEYGRTSFDEATDVLYADVAIRNVGVFPLRTPLLLTVEDISDPQVALRDFDGRLADGTPYYDLSGLVDDGTLSPNEITGIKTLAFSNPGRRQFHYTLALRAAVNRAPGFDSVPNLEVVAGKSYRYTAEAADPDGDDVTYTLAAGPAGMSVGLTSGLVSYNPDSTAEGRYSVIIRADDDKGGSALQSYTLTVLPTSAERAPIFYTPPPITANVGTQYVYQPTVRDPDGDTPVITLTGGPSGASFTNGQLLWTPLPDQVGERTLTLAATDGTLSTNQTFTVRVSPVVGNHAPIIYSTALTAVRVNTGYAYQVRAVDEDRDTLSYAVSSPTLTNLQVDANGVITWTAPGTAGSGDVTVTVSDGKGGTAAQTFTLNILDVTPATVSGVVFNDLNGDGVQQTGEAGQIGWTVFVDRDGSGRRDPGEWSAVTDAAGAYTIGGVLPGSYTLRAERLFDKGFTLPAGGQRAITVSAGQTLTGQTFGTKDQINRDPTMGGTPPATGSVGSLYTFTPTFGDLDGDALRFDAPVNPGGLFIHPITGAVSWTPTADELGDNPVLLRAQDGHSGVALLSFSVNVKPANHRPFITSLPQQGPVELGMTYRYQITALDPDAADTLTYTKLNPTPDGVQVDQNTGVVTWDPQASSTAEGFYTISLQVQDAAGLTAVQTYDLEVGNSFFTDRPPVIISHPRTVTGVGQTYLYPVRGVDPDGNPVTYSLVDPPTDMELDANNVLSWTPTAPGDYTVKVKISDGKFHQPSSDGEYKHTQTFTLTVLPEAPENRRPVILSAPPKYADIGSVFAYNVLAGDLDDDFMRYTLRGKVPDGVVLDPTTGALRWRPAAWQGGPQTISVRAIDRFGAFVDHTFTVLVRDGNRPPLITSSAPPEGEILQPYFYPIRVEDPDGDGFTLTWSGSTPPGLNLVNGVIKGTPTTAGTYDFTIRAEDARGAFSEQPVRLVIFPVLNWPPIVDSNPGLNTVTGGTYTYQVQAHDPDVGDTLSYSVTTVPSVSMTANGTGLVSWSVPSNYVAPGQTATVQVTLRVTDNGTPSRFAEQKYTLTVRGNRSPSLGSVDPQSVTAGNPWRLDLAGTDPDAGDTLTYTLTGRNGTVVPPDVTVNGLGQVRWVGTLVGTYDFTATVSDPYGGSASRDFTLTVLADTEAPSVALEIQDDPGQINVINRFKVDASDNVGVVERKLEVSADNGQTWQTIGLDNDGVGHWTPTAVQVYKLRARAKDAAGLVGEFLYDLSVINPAATGAPAVTITAPAANGEVTALTAVTGTITDNDGLLRWKLDYRPIDGSADWKVIREVTSGLGTSVNVNETFDPTLLANGAYVLRLTGVDTGGNTGTDEVTIQVDGLLKLGNFTLTMTDLTIPVVGIPITIGRVYDTLDSNRNGEVGYGWRVEVGGYEETVDRSTTTLPFLNNYPTFKDGTRVYVKRPDGGLDGYTFTPTPAEEFFGNVLSWYPAFTGDDGVLNRLKVDQVPLIKIQGTGEYIDYELGGYNPANPSFGGAYDVVEFLGLTHEIDGRTGDQIGVRDRNDNKLTFEEDGVVSDTGRQVTFERDAQGRIIALEDPRGNKVRYRYDARGDLVEVTDRLGNTIKFTYRTDHPHYLDQIIDPFGRTVVKNEYSAAGRLSEAKDATGETVEMTYDVVNRTQTITNQEGNPTTRNFDVRGNPTQVVDEEGDTTLATFQPGTNFITSQTKVVGAPGGTDDVTTGYTLNTLGQATAQTDPLGKVSRITFNEELALPETVTDPMGNTTRGSYDTKGNPTSIQSPGLPPTVFTHNSRGLILTQTTSSGTTTNEYDGFGQIKATTPAEGVRSEFVYDANGNVTESKFTWVNPNNPSDTRLVKTTTTYDEADRPISSTDAMGNLTRIEYDFLNRPVKSWDKFGKVTETTYDVRGLVIEVKSPLGTLTRTVHDTEGRVSWTVDEYLPGQRAHGTHTIYDDAGKTRFVERWDDVIINIVTNADGSKKSVLGGQGTRLSVVEMRYDDVGRVTTTIDAAGQPTTLEYDKNGLQTAQINALNQRVEIRYDAASRAIVKKDALGRQLVTTYDELGRVKRMDYPDGTFTTAEYDADGHKIAETDELGQTTNYEYDELGRLKAVVLPQVLDPETNTLKRPRYEYEYDDYGNTTLIRDPKGRETRFTYDQFNHQVSRVLPGGATETWQFNTLGQMTEHVDFKGQREVPTYDAFGRSERMDWYAVGSQTPGDTVTYHYDGLGRMDSFTDARGQTSFTFDLDGLTTRVVTPEGTVNYAFNPATGERTRIFTDSSDIGYTYDELGRLKTVSVVERNGVTLGTPDVTTYRYNAVGLVDLITLPDGVKSEMTYNQRNHVETIAHKTAANVLLSQYVYTLRNDGLIQQVVESNAGGTVSTTGYTYDALGRLTQENYNGVAAGSDYTIDYTLDIVGNRLEKKTTLENGNVTRINGTFNARDWLLTEETRLNGVLTDTATYGYDANGSQTTRSTTSGESATYTWNLRNKLVGASVTAGGQTNTSAYAYDPAGNQVRRTENGTERRLILDPNSPTGIVQVLEELQSGLLVASYQYGLGALSQTQGSTVSRFLSDGHSGVRLLIGPGASVLASYRYDAFGLLLAQTGSAVNLIRYSGERFDPVLGQYNLRARFYDPARGRFTKLDPFAGDPNFPQSFNKYAYTHGDPVNFRDPTGMFEGLIGCLVNMGIRAYNLSLQGRAYSPIMDFIIGAIGLAWASMWIPTWANAPPVPPSLLLGAEAAIGAAIGPVAIMGGLGVELLFSPLPNASIAEWYWTVSIAGSGFSPGPFRAAVYGRIGIMFQYDDRLPDHSKEPDDIVSIMFNIGGFGEWLREKIGAGLARLGPMWVAAQAAVPAGLAAINPALLRLAPQVQGLMGWLGQFGQAGGEVAGMIHQGLNKTEEFLSLFWDPKDGFPWGFDYSFGWDNDGHVSLAYSNYHHIGHL